MPSLFRTRRSSCPAMFPPWSVSEVRENGGGLAVGLVAEEVQGVFHHGGDGVVVLGHDEQVAVGPGHVVEPALRVRLGLAGRVVLRRDGLVEEREL